METVKVNLKCSGCGIDRPCYLQTNREKSETDFCHDDVEELRCVLDSTSQTSSNWVEIDDEEEEEKGFHGNLPPSGAFIPGSCE
ncbi:MAG: hypothetical protein V3V84_08840 [Candidatus Bathyarchaeia archaeon]